MYQSGELDQEIDLFKWSYTDDGQGGKNKKLSVIELGVYAKQRSMTGKEAERYDKLNAHGTDVFVIRYRDDLNESDLIEWYGVKYNIRYIKKMGGRHSFLEIFAEYGWPN